METITIGSSKKSNWKKCVTVLAVVSSIIFIVATALLAHQVARVNEEILQMEAKLNGTKKVVAQLNQSSPICMTAQCITSAAQLIESLDESADPCEDFYQFACGGWMENNPIPPRLSRWSQFGLLHHRISSSVEEIVKAKSHINDSRAINSTRDMFQACLNISRIDELGLEPLVQLLASYGHWPMTVDDWSADSWDWRSLSASLIRSFSSGFILDVFNYIDFVNDPDRNVIYIDQPKLGLHRSVYLNAGDLFNAAALESYNESAVLSALVIRDHLNSTVSDEQIVDEVGQMIQFESRLAEILTDPAGRWKDDRWNNLLRLHRLQDLTDEPIDTKPAISWTKYIRSIYSPLNVSICDEEQVIVMEPNYLIKLMPLLNKTPPRVLVNYMLWRVVMRMAPESGTELVEFFRGVQQTESFWFYAFREQQCMETAQEFWELAITGTFLEKRSMDVGVKRQMETMIDDVKTAFVSLAQEADWMDEETKVAVEEKARAMTHVIAFPDWAANRTALEEYYRPLAISKETHFSNIMQLLRFNKDKELRLLRQPTDRGTWISAPYVVNAFYHGLYNSISFPVGILQPPFYDKGHLRALNYAAIGSVIGHEISHGFDNSGRKRDKKGRLRSWWNNSTVSNYLERAQCFIDQYNNFSVPELAGSDVTHLNGTQTLGENIADNGGLRQAFKAYETYVRTHGAEPKLPGLEKYTMEQLFFIAFANIECSALTKESLRSRIRFGVHCPGRYRVLGPVSNFDEFAKAFQCAVGSPMNPSNKCVLW